MNENLVDYLLKLQNTADYLIRGGKVEHPEMDMYIEIVDNENVRKSKSFSVCECNIYNPLERFFYGEQKRLLILTEYIYDGEYEIQIEGKIDFNKTYIPEAKNKEFYNMAMNRVKSLLKSLGLFIISGYRIFLDNYKMEELRYEILEKCEIEVSEYYDDEEIEDEMENQAEDDMEDDIEDDEIDVKCRLEEVESGYLQYNLKKNSFFITDEEGKQGIEDIPVELVVQYYIEFLMEKERKKLSQKDSKEKRNNQKIKDEER